MPTYEYRCPKGHAFEVFQRMSDDPVAECPECGAAAERLISGGAGFLFKGDGFYITNHRSEDYKKKASKETSSTDGGSTAASGGGEGGSTGGDKKPAPAPTKPKSDS
jgi:putative FmdB family regulatory protein